MSKNIGTNLTVAFNQIRGFVDGGTAAYTVGVEDAFIKIAGAAAVVTLLSPADAGAGRVYSIYSVNSSATVVYNATAIHTFTTAVETAKILSDGSSWLVLKQA